MHGILRAKLVILYSIVKRCTRQFMMVLVLF
jgi:hypothetical protein